MNPEDQEEWVQDRMNQLIEDAQDAGINPLLLFSGFMGGAVSMKSAINPEYQDAVSEIEQALLEEELLDMDNDDDDGNGFKVDEVLR